VNEKSADRVVRQHRGLALDPLANAKIEDWSLDGVLYEEVLNPLPFIRRRQTQIEDLRIRLAGWHFEAEVQTRTFIVQRSRRFL
jgi:hypothetical protein